MNQTRICTILLERLSYSSIAYQEGEEQKGPAMLGAAFSQCSLVNLSGPVEAILLDLPACRVVQPDRTQSFENACRISEKQVSRCWCAGML